MCADISGERPKQLEGHRDRLAELMVFGESASPSERRSEQVMYETHTWDCVGKSQRDAGCAMDG
jgi:hypothetical protein